jgi:hypothetical protein
MASADGASYKQNVFFLSMLRNDKSQRTLSSSLISLMMVAPSGETSSFSAKFRSIMKTGINLLLALLN